MKMNYKIAHDQVWTEPNICLRKLSEFYETQELAARLWQLLLHLGSSGNLPSCPLWLAGNTAGLLPQTINAGQCWQQSTLTLIFQSCPISVSDSSDGFSRFANPTSEDSWWNIRERLDTWQIFPAGKFYFFLSLISAPTWALYVQGRKFLLFCPFPPFTLGQTKVIRYLNFNISPPRSQRNIVQVDLGNDCDCPQLAKWPFLQSVAVHMFHLHWLLHRSVKLGSRGQLEAQTLFLLFTCISCPYNMCSTLGSSI